MAGSSERLQAADGPGEGPGRVPARSPDAPPVCSLDSLGWLIATRRRAIGRNRPRYAEDLNRKLAECAARQPGLRASLEVTRFEFTQKLLEGWEDAGQVPDFDDRLVYLAKALDLPLPEVLRLHWSYHLDQLDLRSAKSPEHRTKTECTRRTLQQLLFPFNLDALCDVFFVRVVAEDGVGIVARVARAVADLGFNISSIADVTSPDTRVFTLLLTITRTPQPPLMSANDAWEAIRQAVRAALPHEARLPAVTVLPVRKLREKDLVAEAIAQRAAGAMRTLPEARLAELDPAWPLDKLLRVSVLVSNAHHDQDRRLADVAYAAAERLEVEIPPSTVQSWARRDSPSAPTLADPVLATFAAMGVPAEHALSAVLRSQIPRGAHASELLRLLERICSPMRLDENAPTLWLRVHCLDQPGLLASVAEIVADASYSIVDVAQHRSLRHVDLLLHVHSTRKEHVRKASEMQALLARAVDLSPGDVPGDPSFVEVRCLGRRARG